MTQYYGIRPLDSLMIRGNRSFGAAGEHGESQMPPWLSLFAGAIRAAMLGGDSEALRNFGPGRKQVEGQLGEVLGTPELPGSFRLAWSSFALKINKDEWSPAIPLPADLSADENLHVYGIEPQPLPAGVSAGHRLPMVPLLRCSTQFKPVSGRWLTGKNLELYTGGSIPQDTRETRDFYLPETRVGIGLNHRAHSAEDGLIYSTEAVGLCEMAGFLVGIDGLGKNHREILPKHGFLRLGGDGKAAKYEHASAPSLFQSFPNQAIERDKRFRLVMTSPGIFAQGWLPNGIQASGVEFRLQAAGVSARLVCAAMGRHDVVSGWDIANWKPKPAERVVPSGSVYWFDQLEGEAGKLANWVADGVWGDNPDNQRQAEGFNRAMLAAWPRRN
jgi:CRISPR-associated protein Cmr3